MVFLSEIRPLKPLHRLHLPIQRLFLQPNRHGVSSVNDLKGNQQGRSPRRSQQLQALHLPFRKPRSLTSLPGRSGDVRDFDLSYAIMKMNHYISAANPLLRPSSAINSPSTAPASIPNEPPPRAGLFGMLLRLALSLTGILYNHNQM